MKKAVILFIFIITALFSSCAPDIVRSGGAVVRSDMPSPANISSYYSDEFIVYVTESGTKYHKEGCAYLKSSKIMISLEQALIEGKQPCSKCFGKKTNPLGGLRNTYEILQKPY